MYEIDADKLYDSIVEIYEEQLENNGKRPENMILKSETTEMIIRFDDKNPKIKSFRIDGYLSEEPDRDDVQEILSQYSGNNRYISLSVSSDTTHTHDEYSIICTPSVFFGLYDEIDVLAARKLDGDVYELDGNLYDSLKESLDTIGVRYTEEANTEEANILTVNSFQGFRRFSTEKFVDAYMKANEKGLAVRIYSADYSLLPFSSSEDSVFLIGDYVSVDTMNPNEDKLSGIFSDMKNRGMKFTDEWELSYISYVGDRKPETDDNTTRRKG